jgi:predicted nucleotidyltransferase
MRAIGACQEEKPVTVQFNSWTYRDLTARQRCLPESVTGPLEFLISAPEVIGVILFGSRAVGDHDDRSDVDIAISAPTLSRTGLVELRDAIGQSRTLFKISISVLERMPSNLKDRVVSQGVYLYERTETER